MELIGAVGALSAVEEVARLSTDRTVLNGWEKGAANPTLGQVASKVAKQLRAVAEKTKSE